ncbi:extensin-2-like [Patiria miniata]|uniref:C2H2-type domain-containing protein n=1 Tax=Patiria miniata TaxID=46514 RepID=A0A914BDE5_PATMI|nr:extensin-2-like [Patiria miniata]
MAQQAPDDLDPSRLLKCRRCTKVFLQRRSLYRHIQAAHGPPLIASCLRCSFKSKRRDNLRRHYRRVHPTHLDDLGGILMSLGEDNSEPSPLAPNLHSSGIRRWGAEPPLGQPRMVPPSASPRMRASHGKEQPMAVEPVPCAMATQPSLPLNDLLPINDEALSLSPSPSMSLFIDELDIGAMITAPPEPAYTASPMPAAATAPPVATYTAPPVPAYTASPMPAAATAPPVATYTAPPVPAYTASPVPTAATAPPATLGGKPLALLKSQQVHQPESSDDSDDSTAEDAADTDAPIPVSSKAVATVKKTFLETALEGRVTKVTETLNKYYRSGDLKQVCRVRVYEITK